MFRPFIISISTPTLWDPVGFSTNQTDPQINQAQALLKRHYRLDPLRILHRCRLREDGLLAMGRYLPAASHYIDHPRTQMTPVLIGKGLVLEG